MGIEFNYMMLDRLQSDCEYYLNYGNRNKKVLWALEEKEQIEEMKKLYNSFLEDLKPEWLTYDKILEYEKLMINNEVTVFISRYSTDTTITFIDKDNLLTDTIITKLKQYFAADKATIYFNDTTCNHWMYDFKIDDVWFSSKSINNELTNIDLICFR